MTSWLVLGGGYTGQRVAAEAVARGDDVTLSRRTLAAATTTAAAIHPAVHPVAIDLTRPETIVVPADAIVVCCAPPGPDPAAEIAALVAAAAGARRLVYVGSTGVYGPGHGAQVDEDAPLVPITAAGRARVIAEHALARASVSTITLRVAGIYGPGRGMVDRLRAGTYRIVGDGHAHVSRIHVDDLVATILAAGTSTRTGAINVADDDPGEVGAIADAVAAALGLPPPPRVPIASVDPEVAGMLTADRRIDNRRLRMELGVRLRYPTLLSSLQEPQMSLRDPGRLT